MKLAIVTPYPPSKITLNEYAYYLVNYFQEIDDIEEIILVVDKLENGESYDLEDHLTKVTVVPTWSFNSLLNPFKILKTLKKYSPDVVLYNIQFLSFGDGKIPATLGLLSPLMARVAGFPNVVLLHNIIETVDLESAGITKNKILQKAYSLIGNVLTRLILQANKVALTIPKYVEIIRNKYKVDNVVHMPHGTFEIMEEPKFSQGKAINKKIMTFGKFGTYKKVEEMIEAVDIVRKRLNENIEIIIAGTDNPNVKGYLKGVEEKYSHIDDITFTGYVAEEDVPKVFTDCTAVVFPYSSTTGSSGVLHQAGSYGKAAILPYLGDLKELIEEEGYKGAYFKAEDVNSMADAIEKVLVDDDYRLSLEKQNYAAASQLSMATIAKRYTELFKEIIKPRNRKKNAVSISGNALG